MSATATITRTAWTKGFICLFLLAFLAISTPFTQSALAQDELSNKGEDFIMTFLPNFDSIVTIELHLTGANTEVTVEYPVNSPTFSETVNIVADDVTIVTIPPEAATAWADNAIGNNAVRAHADEEFTAYMINRREFSSDASLALPVNVMNVETFAVTYPSTLVSGDRSQFAVVAAFDNTTVNITPTNAMGSVGAGDTHVVTLNRGEAFYGRSNTNGPNGDLTGTLVTADRPVQVTSGNRCSNIPSNAAFCDHIFQVINPTQTWGQSAPAANLPLRTNGTVYRILAAEDDTEVRQNGSAIGTIDRGEFIEVSELAEDVVFSAENPILVVQFMTGSSRPGTGGVGDPAMGAVIPNEQYMESYTFSTVGGAQFVRNFVTIIAENDDIGTSMMLDGALVDAGEFAAIPGTSLSVARIEIDEGAHTTASSNPHGISVQGYNNDDSYLYAGGARFQFIAPGEDLLAPECSFEIIDNVAHGTCTDDRDLDRGIFFVALASGATNVALEVDPFTPGDPMVTWRLRLVDENESGSGTVRVTDGAGNITNVEITITVDDEPPVDTTPPECRLAEMVRDNGVVTGIRIEVRDTQSGISSIEFLNGLNARLEVPEGSDNWLMSGDLHTFDTPTNDLLTLLGEKIDLNERSMIVIEVTDDAGNATVCDPVVATLSSEVPEGYDLGQNYPNPFNPTTYITFQVHEASFVTMHVYDLNGRMVATLVNETLEPGTYSVDWEGKNDFGETVASGVYIYRMSAGEYTATKSMVFMK